MGMHPIDIIAKVAPSARENYKAAFRNGEGLLVHYGITTPIRFAHFLAQCCAETGGLTIEWENMNYSASRMLEIFGQRHSAKIGPAEAEQLAHHPEQIADRVYGRGNPKKSRELGNTNPGDGYRYRGGGILQTTGRYNYRAMGKLTGVDFENNPTWVVSAEHALKPALAEWDNSHCNQLADANDLLGISKAINLGNAQAKGTPNGLNDRRAWFNRIWPIVKDGGLDLTGAKPVPAEVKPRTTQPTIAITKPQEPVKQPTATRNTTAGGVVAAGTAAATAAAQQGYNWGVVIAIGVVSAVIGVIIFFAWKANER
jgi:putative chitinase